MLVIVPKVKIYILSLSDEIIGKRVLSSSHSGISLSLIVKICPRVGVSSIK